MTEWIVTSSALILIIIALRGLLKQKLRPTVRYALWGLVLVRLLIPFSFAASPISVENVTQGVKREASTAVTQYETKYEQVMQQYAQMGVTVTPAQAREEARQQVYTDAYASIADRYAQSGISVPEQQLQQEARQQTQSASFLALLSDALPLIWYAGMALMALALLGSNGWFAWNLGRSSISLSQPGFPLRVFETGYTATPCLFGLVRPTVYLTPEAARDPVMRRHVLAHEGTHYRHGDHIWSVLRGVCLILHWYNPLVWAAAILSRKDAELACDEATIRTLGEEERIAYGRTLIGMTCIRHDPKSFLVTATTMTGSKKSLKERISTIARKPQNALYAVIACVLVAAIAVGCTFTGAGTNLTREEAWEKVLSAVDGYNNRDHYHTTVEWFYDFSDDTPDGGLTNEFYQTRESELRITALAEPIEQLLLHNGRMLYCSQDNEWYDFGEINRLTDLSFTVPAEENLVLSWKNEGSQLVVVCDYSYQEPDEYAHMDPTVTFWLNADGSLAKYELHYGVDEDNGPDFIVTQTLTVHTDDAAGVNRKIENVYNEATAALGLEPDQTTPTTEPVNPPVSAELFPFIYRDDPGWDYWREYIGPNDCMDGYLYVQDRATMEITIILDTPVERFVETRDHLFCVMQDGRILQVDYAGANQRTLYQASGEVSDIFHLNSKLYFNDGTELTVLDLDTLTPSVVGSFTEYRTIYAVTETWLWLNIGGVDYAYDTVTGELVLLYTGDSLDRFLAGHWPETPETGVDLPEDYTLADVVTAYEEHLSWESSLGHSHDTPFSIPVIYPFSQDAITVQKEIYSDWMPWLEDQQMIAEYAADPSWIYIEHETSLNGNILSIVIHVWWDSGSHTYQVYNFDLSTGSYLGPAEMANRFLHISYPEFLMAVSEYRMDELQATQPNSDMREYMAEFAPDVAEMDQATLYLDKDGNLCLRYDSLDTGGAMFYPTVKPFSLEDVDWETPTEREAYLWLFDLYKTEDWREHTLSDYWSLLQNAYVANPAHFQGAHSQLDDTELQTQIWDLVTHDDPTKTT